MSNDFISPDNRYEQQDGRVPLAVAAGLVAALVAGAIWAAIVRLTNFEVGYVAWGVGVLVGVAMSRMTNERGPSLAVMAAGLATLGLLAGKAFIFATSSGPIAREILADTAALEGAMAWQMYEKRELNPATLDSVDARQASHDTLSDALWSNMREQSAAKLGTMNGDQKLAVAKLVARNYQQNVGLVNGVKAQFSPFDLLWFFLALGTAYRMMGEAKEEQAPVAAEAPTHT